MREYIKQLENHTDLLAVAVQIRRLRVQLFGFKDYLAACRDFQKVQAAQESGLAAAGRPDDRYDFALVNLFADALQDLQLSEILMQVYRFN